ncbi:MAG: SRPBCC family protein [Chloroflexi bacterium]|nr:SRPBCC family protein [Chloroflexota bacterium]
MKFEHQFTVPAPRAALWAALQDFPRVASCIPGAEEVRPGEHGDYQGSLRVTIGPMGVTLTGSVTVAQEEAAGLWRMTAQAQDRKVGGGARAIIEAALVEVDSRQTALKITADVQLMGRLGELGQPLIKRKADAIFKEFGENLAKLVSS